MGPGLRKGPFVTSDLFRRPAKNPVSFMMITQCFAQWVSSPYGQCKRTSDQLMPKLKREEISDSPYLLEFKRPFEAIRYKDIKYYKSFFFVYESPIMHPDSQFHISKNGYKFSLKFMM